MWYFFSKAIQWIMEYKVLGVCIVNTVLLGLVSWRLFANHLKHMKQSISKMETCLFGSDGKSGLVTDIAWIKGKLNGKS